MSSSFKAYVDESGDEGFKFGSGSSRWFVLSSAVFRAESELSEVKLIDEVREKFNSLRQVNQSSMPPKKPLHFRDLKHDQRRYYAHRIGQAKVKVVSVCIYKPDLTSPEGFQNQNRLYFYATRLLVERVSWLCRDARRRDETGDGTVDLVFSNRSSLNYSELKAYLSRLETQPDYRADTQVIRPDQVETYSAGKRMGLQIADAVASSTFFALEPNQFNLLEQSYLEELASRYYRHDGVSYGYGLKVMPREAEEKRRRGEIKLPLAE